MGTDETVAAVEAVRNEVLATHCLIRRVRFLGLSDGHPSDTQVKWQDRIDRAAEAELYWAAYLAGVRARGHDRAERADIEEAFAHFEPRCAYLLAASLFLLGLRINLLSKRLVSLGNAVIQHRPLLNKDAIAGRAFLGEQDKVPDLALEAHVGDEAMHILGVNAGGVCGIGVTIRIAVLAVEEINEVVAMVHEWSCTASTIHNTRSLRGARPILIST